MKRFAHFNARSVDEAVALLKRYQGSAKLVAGGTDVLGMMKDRFLPAYPEALINLKTIPGLDFIRVDDGVLRIGALTRLEDIARSHAVKSGWPALAEAAHRTASPHLREMGAIGGNICQDVRCWYYRLRDNRFPCLRKGGGRCYALEGDNRYHSIFGGSVDEGCMAVHPSDTAPALTALDAEAVTTKRTIPIQGFFHAGVCRTTVLDDDEIILEIKVPAAAGTSRFIKYALRKSIDFPIVNCAAVVSVSGGKVESARICLNAVYVTPLRAAPAEEFITGKELSEENAKAAGAAMAALAQPLSRNQYMVEMAKTIIARVLLACGEA